MMVPTGDYNNLVNYSKGAITKNALLNKAGRLAAERQLVLTNKNVSQEMALTIAKTKGRQLNRLTRRIQTGSKQESLPAGNYNDDDAVLYDPMENTFKKILKHTKRKVPLPRPPPPWPRPPPPWITPKLKTGSLKKAMTTGGLKGLRKKLGLKSQ